MQQKPLPDSAKTWRNDIIWLVLLLGGLFFLLLGARPLFVPDEGRYAEIAREMVASLDYVTPHLNGIKYFEKPVLFYWLEAGAIQLGGLNLWSLRGVNALLGLLGCLATYFTARKLYNRATGWLAALMLSTSLLYFVMSHMISLDLPVTVFITLSLYAFLLAIQHPPGRTRLFYIGCAAAAAALAVLTKGLIGIVFPVMIVTLWMAATGEWRLLTRLYLPSAFLIFFLIAAPWHMLVQQRHPEFFQFYFIEQHFLRYATKNIGHYQPVWFFIPYFILGFFPWIVFLPQAIFSISLKERRKHAREIFLLIWAISIFIFFSFSKSKLIPYILPVLPPLAILTARYWQVSLIQQKLTGIKRGYVFLCLFAAAIAIGCLILSARISLPTPATARFNLAGAALCLIAGTAWAMGCVARKPRQALAIQFISTALFLLCLYAAMPALDTRSIQPLANKIKLLLTPRDEVVTYNQYFQDLPFYLERRVSILNWRNELSFGIQHRETPTPWILNYATFAQRWEAGHRVFVLMSKTEYPQFSASFPRHVLLGEANGSLLISNKASTAQNPY